MENKENKNRKFGIVLRYTKSFGTYAFSYFFNAGISLLILPVLSHYLSKEDYGVIALFTAAQTLILPFLSMGIQLSMGVDFFKKPGDEFKSYFNTAFKTILSSFLFFTVLAFIFSGFISSRLHTSWIFSVLLPFCVLSSLSADIYLTYLRNTNKAVKFVLFSICRTAFEIGLAVLLVVKFSMGWQGRLYAAVAAAVVILIIVVYFFYRNRLLRWTGFSVKTSREVIKHSLPFIPERISIFFFTAADRFFLERYTSTNEVGLYNMAYNVASLIMMVIISLSAVYVPSVYKFLSEDNKRKALRSAYIFIGVCFICCLGMFIVIPVFFHYIIDQKFLQGQVYAYYLVISMFFWAVTQALYPFLMFHKKNYIIMAFAITGSLLSIGLNLLLTPRLFTWGAIIANGSSYFALTMFYVVYVYFWAKKNTTGNLSIS